MILHQITNSYKNYNYNAYIYTDRIWDTHFHGNYELVYAIEGVLELSVNGAAETLHKGELLLIPPYTIHSLTIDCASKIWVGVFSEDFIQSFFERNKYARYSKFRCDEWVEEFLKKSLFFQGQPEHYSLMSSLYMVCSECVKNAVLSNSNQDGDFMYRVIMYISDNLEKSISLEDIAKEMNYEKHYFSCLFHKCFSMNFKSFINIFRFENACRLLSKSKDDITDICSKCGFGSIRSFNRIFRQLSGVTPSEYRIKSI